MYIGSLFTKILQLFLYNLQWIVIVVNENGTILDTTNKDPSPYRVRKEVLTLISLRSLYGSRVANISESESLSKLVVKIGPLSTSSVPVENVTPLMNSISFIKSWRWLVVWIKSC